MRKLILAALGVFAVSGVASAQQPSTAQPPYAPPLAPAYTPTAPTYSPAALAAASTAGTTVIRGTGCTNCGGVPPGAGTTMRNNFAMVTGGNCMYGASCQNGCGSLKSDLAFQFGTCKQFFSPCGPTCAGGPFSGWKCPRLPFAQPYGIGWQCPRQYDTYANH